jgi:hypothetical protein
MYKHSTLASANVSMARGSARDGDSLELDLNG